VLINFPLFSIKQWRSMVISVDHCWWIILILTPSYYQCCTTFILALLMIWFQTKNPAKPARPNHIYGFCKGWAGTQFKPASPSNLPQADALQEQKGDTNGMPKGQDQSASTALPRQTLGLLADMLLEIPLCMCASSSCGLSDLTLGSRDAQYGSLPWEENSKTNVLLLFRSTHPAAGIHHCMKLLLCNIGG